MVSLCKRSTDISDETLMLLLIVFMMGYAVVKVFFSNLKRGGILLIQISVGSLYMSPDALLAGSRLLNALAQVFRDNSVPPSNPVGMRADSRRRKKLQKRRIALGHRPDDHEDYIDPELNM